MAERLEFVSVKLRWPMTLFTSFAHGRQGVYRRCNRLRNLVKSDRIELIRAGNFRLRISAGARSNVTFDTAHARVRRYLVCDKFGFHCLVAGLSAKLNGLRMLVSSITAKCAHEHEDHTKSCKNQEDALALR